MNWQKKMEERFGEYLNHSSLEDTFYFDEKKNLGFHWANWFDTCILQKEGLYSSQKLNELKEGIEVYKNRPVWVRGKDRSLKTNLFDLYTGYLDPRMKEVFFGAGNETLLISVEKESGPYSQLGSMKWMEEDVYRKFVFQKLLEGYVPSRSFRLSTSIPIAVTIDHDEFKKGVGIISQISRAGLLVKLNGSNIVNFMNDGKLLNISSGIKELLELSDYGLENMTKRLDRKSINYSSKRQSPLEAKIHLINRKTSSVRLSKNSEDAFYFFIPFDAMKDIESNRESVERAIELVGVGERGVRELAERMAI